MKVNTTIWAKFESPGRGNAMRETHGSMADVSRELIKWLLTTSMGHYIKITLARSEHELHRYTTQKSSRDETDEELLAELELMLDQQTLDLGDANESQDEED